MMWHMEQDLQHFGEATRYVYREIPERFHKFAVRVMGLEDTGDAEEMAMRGIEAMEAFSVK